MNRQEELQSAEPQQRDKGFTLIELLIVIVILGILSTIVVLSVRGITDQGESSACAADLKTLEIAQEAASAKNIPLVYTPAGNAETQLVNAGLLRSTSGNYDIRGPVSIVATSSQCGASGTAATTVAAGAPGVFGPVGAVAPASLVGLQTSGIVGGPEAWATGQYVLLADLSEATWKDTDPTVVVDVSWVAGRA